MEDKDNERITGLFLNMILQHTNMAMVMLGQVAHPETGQKVHEPDSARMLIDQLEMLEAKTRGNLTQDEENFLKQSLHQLRMAYVQGSGGSKSSTAGSSATSPSSSSPSAAPSKAPEPSSPKPGEPTPQTSQQQPSPQAPASAPEESKKRFTKKYE